MESPILIIQFLLHILDVHIEAPTLQMYFNATCEDFAIKSNYYFRFQLYLELNNLSKTIELASLFS